MSEEIQNATVVVPRALVLSIFINGILGLAMVLGLMFCIGDVETALNAEETLGFPFLEVFLQSTRSVTGSAMMASIIIVMGVGSTVGAFATAARMLWSFSRDRGPPFAKYISQVGSYPIRSEILAPLTMSSSLRPRRCRSMPWQ